MLSVSYTSANYPGLASQHPTHNLYFGEKNKKPATVISYKQHAHEQYVFLKIKTVDCIKQGYRNACILKRKVQHPAELKRSVKQGWSDMRESFQEDFKSGSKLRITKRIAHETSVVVIFIILWPLPGPNPAWLILTPGARSFIKGFMKEEDALAPNSTSE